jgi:peptidoglycan/LPS O-acetylase OafA/YrhL
VRSTRKDLEDSYSERAVVAKTGQARACRGSVITVCADAGAESELKDDEQAYAGDRRMTSPHAAEPAAKTETPSLPRPAATGATATGSRLAWLDVLRGLAALAVVFNHFGYFLPPAVKTSVYQWINPGDYGVFVFFLISGYIVPASLERKGSVRTFWVSRLFRLYPLYLLAVAIAVTLYLMHVGGLRGEDGDPETSILSQMLMMSNVLAGQNIPNVVWSLSYEMIFYLLLTALFMARVHQRSSRYALAFAVVAVGFGGLLPQAYFTNNLWSPRIIALVADLVVLTGLAVAVAMRGMPRLVGAVLAAMVGLTLLAFNGTWLLPWEALSILALMFTGTMLYRAEQGQYPWRKAIPIAVAVLGMAIAAGLWHHLGGYGLPSAIWERDYFMSLFLAGVTFAIGLALRHVAWPRSLTWLGLISYSVYLLHPLLIEVYRYLPWTAHHSFWIQVLVDALFLAVLIAVCSATYLLVERPMQNAGRRLAKRLDARFGPDRIPVVPRAPEPVLAHTSAD